MLIVGIDSGSTTTKGVLLDNNSIIKTLIEPTGYNPKSTMMSIHSELTKGKEAYTVTTGYGRNLLENADKSITEITCHAKGAAYLCSGIDAVIDIGGQDSKAIMLSSDGQVIDFLMNDKCAAGTGRFIEVMMKILHKDIGHIDSFIKDKTAVKISSMCTVFAESEVISLLANNNDPGNIAKGIIDSICIRTSNFAKKMPINSKSKVFFSGGLAKSNEVRLLLAEKLNCEVVTHEYAQYVGAIGAAVIGNQKANKILM